MEYNKLNQPAAMGRKRIAVAAGDARAESRRTRSALGGAVYRGVLTRPGVQGIQGSHLRCAGKLKRAHYERTLEIIVSNGNIGLINPPRGR